MRLHVCPLLLAFGCRTTDRAGQDGVATRADCGPEYVADGLTNCPAHPCAGECASVDEGIACCIESEGRGLTDRELREYEQEVYSYVEPTDTGVPSPEECLSSSAAICAAQVQGLELGVGSCITYIQLDGSHGSIWKVYSVHDYKCGPADAPYQGTSVHGMMMSVDLVSGLEGYWGNFSRDYTDPLCEPDELE